MRTFVFIAVFVGTSLLLPLRAWAAGPSAPAHLPRCGAHGCAQVVLSLLDADRAAAGAPPLRLARKQSTGLDGCAGSWGHSAAMAASGSIWHIDRRYPRASFPRNFCVAYRFAGENVGEAASGDVTADLQTLDRLMMSEPHSTMLCRSTVNHACNILNPHFHKVGIGVDEVNGTTWLTEDFIG